MPPLYARSRGPWGNPATTREGGPSAQELRSPSASQETCSGCVPVALPRVTAGEVFCARIRSRRPLASGSFFCFLRWPRGPGFLLSFSAPRGRDPPFFDPLEKARPAAAAFSGSEICPERGHNSGFPLRKQLQYQATGLEQAPRRNIRKRQAGSRPVFFVDNFFVFYLKYGKRFSGFCKAFADFPVGCRG